MQAALDVADGAHLDLFQDSLRNSHVVDNFVRCRDAVHGFSSGNRRVTVVPRPSRLATSTRPAGAVRISRTWERPVAQPPSLGVCTGAESEGRTPSPFRPNPRSSR